VAAASDPTFVVTDINAWSEPDFELANGVNRPIPLRNSIHEFSQATGEKVELIERPRIDDRRLGDGQRTPQNSAPNGDKQFFNRIDAHSPLASF